METTKQLELRNLAHLDVDAIQLYEVAIQHIDVPMVREKLTEFRSDHARHVEDLNAEISRITGTPVPRKPDLRGAILRGFTAISTKMSTHAALLAMTANEELTNRAYESALKIDWSPDQRALIEKNYSDEKRHLAWIKQAAKEKPWEHGAEASDAAH
jgi:rubrerythrin